MSKLPLNVGLVGGGKGAFIVQPHQKAIHFDGTRRVVAAALFPDPKVAWRKQPIGPIRSRIRLLRRNDRRQLSCQRPKLDYVAINP